MRVAALAMVMALLMAPSARAGDVPTAPDFAFLASDRVAANVGDTLTVLVLETSSAATSSTARTRRALGVEVAAEDGVGSRARSPSRASLDGRFDGAGQRALSGRLVAQLGVTVVAVAANGDLDIAGVQKLTIDGERTRIRLQGHVRPTDIAADNTVLSSRLSGVVIDYDGGGFAGRSARPGVVGRVLSWLGLV